MTQYIWVDSKTLKLLHDESLTIFGGSRGIRDEALFESAMARPQNLIAYNPDADIADLAASYGYGLAKNHAFIDGNKRVAFLAVGIFLGTNGYKLLASQIEAIQAVLGVASGELSEENFATWIRAHIQKI